MTVLAFLRGAVFAVFVLSTAVAIAAWAVRTRAINPFSGPGRLARRLTDPILAPVEHWLVRRGGNPQHAEWWLFGASLFGGIVLIALATWIVGQVGAVTMVSRQGPRSFFKLMVYGAGQLIQFALMARVVGSWFGGSRYTRWLRPAYVLTDWIVEPLRRWIPPFGMIDMTPMIAWFLIWLIEGWLMGVL